MYDADLARAEIDSHLRKMEGERLKPYRCSAGVPTIGVGATRYPDGRVVTMQDPEIAVERMNQMLATEVERYTDAVLPMVHHECTTMQLVALVLLGYNIGLKGLESSTAIRLHNKGDFISASNAFSLWNKVTDPATGKKVRSQGLSVRRTQEAAIYLSDLPTDGAVPQAAAPERKVTASPSLRSGVAVVSGGAAVVAQEAAKNPQDAAQAVVSVTGRAAEATTSAKTVAESIGVSLPILLGAAIAGAGAVMVYRKWMQREEGVA